MIHIDEIKDWAKDGLEENATHLVIMLDSYSGDYYPKYFYSENSFKESMARAATTDTGQYVKYKYDLSKDIESQYVKDVKDKETSKNNNSQKIRKKKRFDDEYYY